jgi:two-component system chemotaxis response regulator CheB
MSKVELIVIGASAGGLDALTAIVRQLPKSLPAAVLIVMHTNSRGTSYLPEILGRVSKLPVAHASGRDRVTKGRILIAPPDFHLLVVDGRVSLTRGPRENGFRPAIDPLFRSASLAYGDRLMGVILSGALDDGTYGMQVIQENGGVTVVQDPDDAQIPSMPRSVLASVPVDHVLPAAAIAGVIEQASRNGRTSEAAIMARAKEPEPQDIAAEMQVEEMLDTFGPPSGLTCPDCGGALWQVDNGTLTRYRCHVGHQFSPDGLEAAQHDLVEEALWSAVRALEEHADMKQRMADRAGSAGLEVVRDSFITGAEDSHRQAKAIRDLLFNRRAVVASDAHPAAPSKPRVGSARVPRVAKRPRKAQSRRAT